MAKIWADVFSIDEVGIHDDFFALGGHSLAAFRVIARVVSVFQFQLPIHALFNSPTVAAMATIIAGNTKQKASEEELRKLLNEIDSLAK